jgi:hypothetical protein
MSLRIIRSLAVVCLAVALLSSAAAHAFPVDETSMLHGLRAGN